MKINKYQEFITEGIGFDKDILNQIINLNNSKEFREHGIALKEIDLPKYDNYDDVFEKPFKIVSRSIKELKNPIKCIEIDHRDGNKYDNRNKKIGIRQHGDEYDITFFGWLNVQDKDIRFMNNQPHKTKKSEIVDIIKSNIIRDQLHYLKVKEATIKLQEENARKYRENQEKFNKAGINKQFIEDEFANVFDLCDSHQIPKIEFGMKQIQVLLLFKSSPLSKSIRKTGSDYRGRGGDVDFEYFSGQMDTHMNDVLSELIEISDRIKDERGILTYINFIKTGIEVVLDITNLK